jgi:hypothetical protein
MHRLNKIVKEHNTKRNLLSHKRGLSIFSVDKINTKQEIQEENRRKNIAVRERTSKLLSSFQRAKFKNLNHQYTNKQAINCRFMSPQPQFKSRNAPFKTQKMFEHKPHRKFGI